MGKKDAIKQREDIKSSRMLVFVTMTFAAIILLMYLYRRIESISGIQGFSELLYALMGASAVSLAWGVLRLSGAKNKDKDKILILPTVHIVLSLFAIAAFYFIKEYYLSAIQMMYFILPVICVLYAVSVIYGAKLFLLSFFQLTTAGALFIYYQLASSSRYASYIVFATVAMVAYAALFMAVFMYIKKNKGKVTYKGTEIEVFKQSDKNLLFYISAAVVAALGVAYMISPTMVSYYGFFVIGGLLAVSVLYYTYRLMYSE